MIEQKIEQKTISKTCVCEKSQFRCWFSCCLMFISELAKARSCLYLAVLRVQSYHFLGCSTVYTSTSYVGSMASALQHKYTTDLIHYRSYHTFMLSNRSENVLRKCFCYFFSNFDNFCNVGKTEQLLMPWPGWTVSI